MFIMATALAIASIVISVLTIAASITFAILSAKGAANMDPNANDPSKLEDFSITSAKEGSIVPICYGRVRVGGNIIWYGNLHPVPIIEYSSGGGGKMGGGGGGSSQQVTGYQYYLDLWITIAFGKYTLIKTWINDKEGEVFSFDELFNDGTEVDKPSQFGFSLPPPNNFVNAIPNVCWIYWNWFYLGDNTTHVPTVHYLIERILDRGITDENMANGSNPAAIIFDMLKLKELDSTEIDTAAFNTAAVYWSAKGYGLNLKFDRPEKVRNQINKVLSYVDGVVHIDNDGKYTIKTLDPAATPVKVLSDNDYYDFIMKRVAWPQIKNNYKAMFIDETQEYTSRALFLHNPAAIFVAGEKTTANLDMAGFRDVTTASKRLWEIVKRITYPAMDISIEGNLALSELFPGDIVTINNSDFSIANAGFRITEVNIDVQEKNSVKLKLTQVVEDLFDDVFLDAGGSESIPLDTTLAAFNNIRVFELPYNNTTGFGPAFLLLVKREKGIETGFTALYSQTAVGGYLQVGSFTGFAQRGLVKETYPSTTRTIDRDQGILYLPDTFDPSFDPISYEQLFTFPRLALINDELIAFQDIQPEGGGGEYRLSTCIRGVMHTTKAAHAINDEIWIFNLQENILENIEVGGFYLKLLPYFDSGSAETFDPDLVSPILVSVTNKGSQPRIPARLVATRSGGTVVDLEIHPNTPDVRGAGEGGAADSVTDASPPFQFVGDLKVDYSSTTVILTATTLLNIDPAPAGAFDITVVSRRFGFVSPPLVVSVGAANGVYRA